MEELFAGQPKNIPIMLARQQQVARELGLPFGERTMTFNSRLAQELGKWAEDQGHGDAFHHAVFRAYFQHGKNIALHPVLLELCSAVGLDPKAAQTVLDKRSYRESVDQDWRQCRQMGISVVPTFILNGRRVEGAQPYAALDEMVLSAGVNRRR